MSRKISWFQVICFEMNVIKTFITDKENAKIKIKKYRNALRMN